MSDYWIVVTMHSEDPMPGQFDKYFTRFRNCTGCFSCSLSPTPKHKLQNFHSNATLRTLNLHHKQFSKTQIHKTQNSAKIYISVPQRHTQTIQGSCHRSQGYSSACHHEYPGSIPDHWMWGLC